MFPWQSCLLPLSYLQREVKVLPRTPPHQSPSSFWACSLNPAMLAILPLSCSLLPTSHSPVPLFMGLPERRGDFSFPCLLHSITPICSPRPLVLLFFRVVWIWALYLLSGMLFWTRLVWEGGLVHRPARGVGEMCLSKLIRIFSSRNANGGKAIKAACFLLSNLC